MGKPAKTAEERQRDVIESYQRAYKLVYGTTPAVTASGGYFRVAGQSSGVSLKRLKTMTSQLSNAHKSINYTNDSTQRPAKMFRR